MDAGSARVFITAVERFVASGTVNRRPTGNYNLYQEKAGESMISRCLTGLATIAFMGQSAVAEFVSVVPPGVESVEGNGKALDTDPPPNGARTQQVYPASFFSDVPVGQHTITAMAWRPDQAVASPQSSGIDLEIWLSTTEVGPGAMSMTFASNRGADHTLVYSGPITFETTAAGPAEGPRPFDYVIELQTPFEYDTTQGNLLREYVYKRGTFVGTEPPTADTQHGFGSTTTVIAFEDAATMATLAIDDHIITQFTFVPEPSTLLLAGAAGLGLLGSARRRTNR